MRSCRSIVIAVVLGASGGALAYSTYLGGTDSGGGDGEQAFAIAVEATGSAVVAGLTFSADFPGFNATQGFGGVIDVFVTRLGPTGQTLVYST